MPDLATDLYEGAASFGKFKAVLSLIIGIIISVILIGAAIYFYTRDESHLIDTKGTIVTANCQEYTNEKKEISYNCTLDINYTVDDKMISGKISTISKIKYFPNTTIEITYDKSNPVDVSLKIFRSHHISYILICVAIIILISSGIYYYINSTYKIMAASDAASSILGTIAQPFMGKK